MDAGKLTKRITLQEPVQKQAPSGQKVTTYKDYKQLWAQIVCTDSRTVDDSGVVVHEGLYRIYIRYTEGIRPDFRVKYGGRYFQLVGPPADWDGTKEGLTLICREMD